jgi:hypothetical protein
MQRHNNKGETKQTRQKAEKRLRNKERKQSPCHKDSDRQSIRFLGLFPGVVCDQGVVGCPGEVPVCMAMIEGSSCLLILQVLVIFETVIASLAPSKKMCQCSKALMIASSSLS